MTTLLSLLLIGSLAIGMPVAFGVGAVAVVYFVAGDFPLTTGAAPRLSEGIQLPPHGIDLEQLERSLVVQALERSGWNQTRAATLLGLNRDQIRYRIEKFKLDRASLQNG